MNALRKHFDRVAIISLPERADRRQRLLANLKKHGLATEEDITWVDAVNGKSENIPDWWESGPGAWGCRFSQLRVLQDAQRDGKENVLILEDDAVFHQSTAQSLDTTMPLLPDDWDIYFLGGQHMYKPSPTHDEKLLKGKYITRTHAYAVNHRIFQPLIDLIGDDEEYKRRPGWHVDHQLGHCQYTEIISAYAPTWWMAGQDEGLSDIAAESFGRRWWQHGLHYWKLPFVQISDELHEETSDWVYQPDTPIPDKAENLPFWLRDVAREAWFQGKLPSCGQHLTDESNIIKFWPGGLRKPQSNQQLKSLANYPFNGLFPHPFSLT